MEGTELYRVVTGSTAYGLDVEGSDVDEKGVYMPGLMDLVGFHKAEETVVQHEPDIEFHTLTKFIQLASKQNPTILEMLFVEDRFVKEVHPLFQKVLDNRDLFITKNVYKSFSGYASDQLMRIKNSLNKATKEDLETHALYVLNGLLGTLKEKHPEMYGEENFVFEGLELKENGKYRVDVSLDMEHVDFTELFPTLNQLNNTVKNFNKRKNRNKKTKDGKLEKHAMHLVRLLLTGIEALQGKGINVYREDRERLLRIRRGEMSWESLFMYADELFKEMDEALEHSTLPDSLDEERIVQLHDEVMKEWVLEYGFNQ